MLFRSVSASAATSKREAREFIKNGAVLLNGVQQKDIEYSINLKDAIDNYIILRRGKKNYYLITIEE